MIFSERLKSERTLRGWTQEELAENLFVSRQSVSKWENAQNYPSIDFGYYFVRRAVYLEFWPVDFIDRRRNWFEYR